jgi:hypothetical protein
MQFHQIMCKLMAISIRRRVETKLKAWTLAGRAFE